MHLVSKISKSPSFYVKFWFWLVQNANLIFAGLYLHRHPAEQAKTDSLRLTPLLENRKNAIECLNASSSLKFSGLRCYLLIWVFQSQRRHSLKKSWEEKEEGALRDSALPPRLLSFIKGSIKGRRLFTSEFGLVLKWSFRIWIPLRP